MAEVKEQGDGIFNNPPDAKEQDGRRVCGRIPAGRGDGRILVSRRDRMT